MHFREMRLQDIPEVFEVRLATDENRFTREELARYDITEESIAKRLQSTYKGWICEMENRIAGFAIADGKTWELWLIAVHPEFINRKIGSTLLQLAENWMIGCGAKKLWLITDPDRKLRAWKFYTRHGWKEIKTENGILFMGKDIG